jgi:hypothetical protein
LRHAAITPAALALMTAVTPPDWAYRALLRGMAYSCTGGDDASLERAGRRRHALRETRNAWLDECATGSGVSVRCASRWCAMHGA